MDFQWQLRQNTDEYRDYLDSLRSWEEEIKRKELEAKQKPSSGKRSIVKKVLPPVRNSKPAFTEPEEKKERIPSYDYRAWDKFDVDAACEQVEQQQSNLGVEASVELLTEELKLDEERVQKALEEKEKGNACFKRSDFEDAVAHYTKSIGLDPTNPVYYLNRAMALLKLCKYKEVEADCSLALEYDPKSVKALWRRSIAYKHMGNWTGALQDLTLANVLAPTDTSIKKDLAEVEASIRTRKEQPERRRVPIVEIGDVADQTGSARTPNSIAPSTSAVASQEKEEAKKKKELAVSSSPRKVIPLPEMVVPRNAIDFERDWKQFKSSPDALHQYIRLLDPTMLPTLFKTNLQSEHLSKFIAILDQFYKPEKQFTEMTAVLAGLCKAERFSMNLMFLTKKDKQLLADLFSLLRECGDNRVDKSQVDTLQKVYGVK